MVDKLKVLWFSGRWWQRPAAGLALWLLNVAAALDQLVNAIAGGHPAHTVSRRLGGWLLAPEHTRRYRLAKVICRALSRDGVNHCAIQATRYDWGRPFHRGLIP